MPLSVVHKISSTREQLKSLVFARLSIFLDHLMCCKTPHCFYSILYVMASSRSLGLSYFDAKLRRRVVTSLVCSLEIDMRVLSISKREGG